MCGACCGERNKEDASELGHAAAAPHHRLGLIPEERFSGTFSVEEAQFVAIRNTVLLFAPTTWFAGPPPRIPSSVVECLTAAKSGHAYITKGLDIVWHRVVSG